MRCTWIWIHGWGMSPEVWGGMESRMPEERHRMFSYAKCGSVDQMRERLRLMIREETAPVRLIGWSLGGMLALEAALEPFECVEPGNGRNEADAEYTPHPIAQVLLIGATLRFAGPDRTKSWPERVVRRMRAQLGVQREETRHRFAESMFSDEEREGRPEYPQWIARSRIPTDFSPEGLDAGLQYLLETDLTERWRHFAAVCLEDEGISVRAVKRPDIVWMHGENDPICPTGAIADIPDRGKILFRGAGHAPFMTEPDRFAEAVRRIVHEYR
nr:alpha/beta hydrolase [Paenibacillus mesophilus]